MEASRASGWLAAAKGAGKAAPLAGAVGMESAEPRDPWQCPGSVSPPRLGPYSPVCVDGKSAVSVLTVWLPFLSICPVGSHSVGKLSPP